jgi:hypothetical protein
MIKTSTPEQNLPELAESVKPEKRESKNDPEPSERVINAILNYSRNLEVISGQLVRDISYLKS